MFPSKPLRTLLLMSVGCMCSGAVLAEPVPVDPSTAAIVSGQLRRPANFIRDDQVTSLIANLPMEVDDRVVTGQGGFAELRYRPTGRVVIGANSELVLTAADPGVAIAMSLRRGIMETSGAGTLQLRLGPVQVRAKDAALWAEHDGATVRLCDISGRAEVATLNGPRTLQAPGACLSIDPTGQVADMKADLAVLRARTTIPAGDKTPMPAKGWTLVVASIEDEPAARAEVDGLQAEGVPARLWTVTDANGQRRFRIAVGGFPTRDEAMAYSRRLMDEHGLPEAWPAQY